MKFEIDSLDNFNEINSKDSLNTDKVIADSIIFNKYNKYHGTLDFKNNEMNISKVDIQEINYLDVFDILGDKTNSFLIILGFNSTPSLLYNLGVSNSQNYLVNGADNLINDNRFNFTSIYSPENFEKIEIFSGSSAILRSDYSNGYLLNIVEINHNSSLPYTRLWLSESAGGLIGVDGIFSQNVLPNLSLTIGFKNMNSDGIYNNSGIKNLNYRTKLSYFINDSSTLSLSYNFYNLFNGLNGGLDKLQSVDESNNFSTHPNDAFVNYGSNSNQRLFKTDFLLTYSGIYYSNKFNLNLFTNENEYDLLLYTQSPTNNDSLINKREKFINRNSGISFSSQLELNKNYSIDFGGKYILHEARTLNFEKSIFNDYSLYSILNLDFGSIVIEPGVRLFSKYDNTSFVYGTNFKYILSEHKFRIDVSNSEKSYLIANNVEKHFLGLFEYDFKYKQNHFLSSIYFRKINNPLLININSDEIDSNNDNYINIFGLNIFSNYKLLNKLFYTDDYVNTNFKLGTNFGDIEYVPQLSSQIGLNWNFSRGRSNAKIGFNYTYNTKFKPKTFVPNTGFIQQGEEIGNSNILDVFVLIKLGHAYLKVSYKSLLGMDYYSTYLYPSSSNYLQITASWTITP